MEFCLLGPLVVRRGGIAVQVRRGKQRAVLAALLLSANQVVRVDDLAEVLWGVTAPPSARVSVQNYVKRLRQALGDAGRDRICTEPCGYLIRVEPGELDISRFEALAGAVLAEADAGSWHQASALARTALALWRGEPLADVESDALARREVQRLKELRLRVLSTRLEAGLELGGHADVVPELQQLVSMQPLHEHLHGLLMLALYRCGRQGDALAAYRAARRVLIDELGTEPSAELRDLYQRMLCHDPGLASATTTDVATVTAAGRETAAGRTAGLVVPRQLPAGVPHFAGRPRELWLLRELAQEAAEQGRGAADGEEGGTAVVAVITGIAGVGKTALAVSCANRVADRFPDGQLYAELRGFGPAGEPADPAVVLRGFLGALGVPPAAIPARTEDLAGQYRSLLAGRRMLVVLDNARDAAQVRSLLPGSHGCLAVVTSRNELTGLVAREGARPVMLDVLPDDQARELLAGRLGAGRVEAEPGAVADLVRLCAGLPLALAIAAARGAAWPGHPLAALSGELGREARLDGLDAGGHDASLRAVFSWSYRLLSAPAARMFRLAGLHPGPDISVTAAASLAGVAVPDARAGWRELTAAGLADESVPGRYVLHDLLCAYAAEQAHAADTAEDRHAALTGLLDGYVAAAASAMNALIPAERHLRPRVAAVRGTGPIPPTGTAADAQAWLSAELANLVAATARAATGGWPGHATRLAGILFRYLDSRAHFREGQTVHAHALEAARLAGDRAARADAARQLAGACWRLGQYSEASGHLDEALSLYRDLDYPQGEALTLLDYGLVLWSQGRYRTAAQHLRHAVAANRGCADPLIGARILAVLGSVRRRQGHYRTAASLDRAALELFRELGMRETGALVELGHALCGQGQYSDAVDCYLEDMELSRELGMRDQEAEAMDGLGVALRLQGHNDDAISRHRQAVDLYRQCWLQHGQAEALGNLGDALAAGGRHEQARARYQEALPLAEQTGSQYLEAKAHDGLARSYLATGDVDTASRHWRRALAIYADLDVPEADQVRLGLSDLAHTGRTE